MPKLAIQVEDLTPQQQTFIRRRNFELKDLKHRIRRLPATPQAYQLLQDYRTLRQKCFDEIEELVVENLIPTEEAFVQPDPALRKSIKLQTARKSTGTYKAPLKRIARPASIEGRIEEATRQHFHYTIDLSTLPAICVNRIQFFLPQSTLDTNQTLYIPYDPFPDQIKLVHEILSQHTPIPSFIRHQRN